MIAFIVLVAVTLWVAVDAVSRKNSLGWAFGALLLNIIFMPLYLAKRNLKAGETREGGTGWNFAKYFALYWTAFMAIVAVSSMATLSNTPTLQNEYEQAGYVIGTGIGLSMIFGLWFFVVLGALIIGLLVKRSSIIEKGPTGRLENPDA